MGSFPLALVIVQREGFSALFRLVMMMVVTGNDEDDDVSLCEIPPTSSKLSRVE